MLVKKQYYWDCSQPSEKKTMSTLTSYTHYRCIVVTIITEWGWVWYEELYRRCYTPRPKAKAGNRLGDLILHNHMEAEVYNSFISHSKYFKVLNNLASSKTFLKKFACLLTPLQNNEKIIFLLQILLKRWQHSPRILHFFPISWSQ